MFADVSIHQYTLSSPDETFTYSLGGGSCGGHWPGCRHLGAVHTHLHGQHRHHNPIYFLSIKYFFMQIQTGIPPLKRQGQRMPLKKVEAK